MTKTLRALAAALALTSSLPACAQQKPAAATTTTDADPALWVVKDKDTTIYLFGTIHVLKPGLTWFDEAVRTAFDRSGELVLELVMPDPAAMQGLVKATGIAPAGAPPLTQQLPVDKRAAFARAVTDLGLPANALDRYRPWLAATQLSLGPLAKSGYVSANGPEEVITEAAKKAGKPIAGLETAQQQLGYFASLSQPAQIEFLVSTLDEIPQVDDEMGKMVDNWANGRTEALAADLNEDLVKSPEIAKVLLVDRNKRWATWIRERMARPGTVFVAVGAGHLAGKDSVQAQLAKAGVKAVRVKY